MELGLVAEAINIVAKYIKDNKVGIWICQNDQLPIYHFTFHFVGWINLFKCCFNDFQSWSPVERLTAINNLIVACEPSEVRHMMRVIEPQFQRDFISLLPKEVFQTNL